MENKEDKELERIRQVKLKKMMEKSKRFQEKPLLNKPIEVTDATFDKTVQNFPFVVIDCWATWCGPCRTIAPIIEELAREYAGKVLFGKLDVDKNRAVAMQYQINSIPTLIMFSHGKLVNRIVGALPKHALESQMKRSFIHAEKGRF